MLPGLRLLSAALRLLCLREDSRTLLYLRLLALLLRLLLLLSTLLRRLSTLLLRRFLRALRLLLCLRCSLLLLRLWLLSTLLRLRLRFLPWSPCALRFLLRTLWFRPGLLWALLLWRLLHTLLLLLLLLPWLLSVLLLRRFSALLRLSPLPLSLFVVALRVSRYYQSCKQAHCRGGHTCESHVINSYRSLVQARGMPSDVVHTVHYTHHANKLYNR